MNKICQECNKQVRKPNNWSLKRWAKRKYCSVSCSGVAVGRQLLGRRGKKHSEETKKKLSELHKGKKFSLESRKKMSEVKKRLFKEGKIIPPTRGKKMSKERLLKQSGSNCYNWKGGVTPINRKVRNSLEYAYWRKNCLERDNFTCSKCEQHGGDLNVHHINNFSEFPELRFIPANGITLCKECHNKFHSIYGKKNNTLKQVNLFCQHKNLTPVW